MGGKVAQLLASRRPHGLEGLVLVASSPPVPMSMSEGERAQMAHAYDSAESIGFVLDNVLTATRLSKPLRTQVIDDSLCGAAAAKAGWPQGAMLEDISMQISSIDVPTVILAGELDKVDSVATLRRELLPRIANARMQVLPGVGHLSPLEAPLAIAQGILGLVNDIENGSRQRN
jgi:pimeloyl-ACP methyl ester carboxylesterase